MVRQSSPEAAEGLTTNGGINQGFISTIPTADILDSAARQNPLPQTIDD